MQHLAARGYVAASVTYRLAHSGPFPAAVQDVNGALRFLRASAQRFSLDPARVCVVGQDAGGTLALLAALASDVAEFQSGGPAADQSTRVSCAAAVGAPVDLSALAAEKAFIVPDLVAWLGGTPETVPAAYELASPTHWVTPDAPPILLVHGDADGLAPVAHARALAARLTAARAHAEIEIMAGVHHTPTSAQRQAAWARVDRFLDTHLGSIPPTPARRVR
jgi:acetyl esterase/lipase